MNFTELHPDIIAAKRLITQLEERKKEEAKLVRPSSDPGKNYSPMLQQLNVALAEAEADVASMRARVEEYTSRYERLKSLSNAVPQVEAELAQLNRDYQVNKSNYEKLLERRESAKISGELGSATDLMSFRIIDPPTVPDLPAGPDRGKLFSLVFLGSLVVGIGIAFIASQIRPTFHSQMSLREITGRPILGSIPMIWTSQEKNKRRKRLYAFGLSLLSLLGLYGLLMVRVV
jgi:polysaccharide chain length determinant protein (PEP-CTERM system associated)